MKLTPDWHTNYYYDSTNGSYMTVYVQNSNPFCSGIHTTENTKAYKQVKLLNFLHRFENMTIRSGKVKHALNKVPRIARLWFALTQLRWHRHSELKRSRPYHNWNSPITTHPQKYADRQQIKGSSTQWLGSRLALCTHIFTTKPILYPGSFTCAINSICTSVGAVVV